VELEQAVGQQGEVGHQVVLAEETAERRHHPGDVGVGRVHQFVELALGLFAPMPRVFKRRDLCLAVIGRARHSVRAVVCLAQPGAHGSDAPYLGRLEQEIVVALGVERRGEVDGVNGFRCEVVADHIQIIPEEKLIHAGMFYPVAAAAAITSCCRQLSLWQEM